MTDIERSEKLMTGMCHAGTFLHPVGRVERIETHISFVILAGDFAYKFKKPLDLGFLDFSTLDKRHAACDEEIRLNRRTAPEIYLDVVGIRGTVEAPRLDGGGEILEYAVRMRRFEQDRLLSTLLEKETLDPEEIDRLAEHVAQFHESIAIAPVDCEYGTVESVVFPVQQNFEQVRERVDDVGVLQLVDRIAAWSEVQAASLGPVFERRRTEGRVRECHGDLHLGNIVLLDDGPRLFDCIEFNPSLRWTDVMADVAFLVMDLEARDRADLAARFIDTYLEQTGDYGGLSVLRFYVAYRAMVRAKVAAIRLAQVPVAEREACFDELRRYLDLAARTAVARPPCLFVVSGVSGSGKSLNARVLVARRGVIRLRSDVERKRLFGMSPAQRSGSVKESGIYTADATRRTYARLAELAESVVRAGYPALVDATFLKQADRSTFRKLAARLHVPCIVLVFDAPEWVLRDRVRERAAQGLDASEADVAILETQLENREPLLDAERKTAIGLQTDVGVDWPTVLEQIDRYWLSNPDAGSGRSA